MEKIDCRGIGPTHRIVAIAGRPGTGKTTLVKAFTELVDGSGFIRGWTTRKPRDNEECGREYDFTTPAGFRAMQENQELLWDFCVHGYRYGTTLKQLEEALAQFRPGLTVVSPATFTTLRRYIPQARLTCVYLESPPDQELTQRMLARGEQESSVKRRLYDSKFWDITVRRQIDEMYCVHILPVAQPAATLHSLMALLGISPQLPA